MGSEYAQAARSAAAAFPETRFAVVGAEDPGPSARGGIAYLGFAEEESSFLAGVLAGLVASDRPGARVGFIGGMDTPEVRACDAGFCAGAAYANPSLRRPGMIQRQYCGKGEEAFSDPAVAAAIASMQYRAGAEAVYHAAGASAAGIYEAARKAGKLVLSSDAGRGSAPPGAADPVLGMASKDAGRAFLVLAREYLGTGSVTPGYRRLGLAAGAVAFEAGPSAGAHAAPWLPSIDAARAKLASGEIAAPRDELAYGEFLRALKQQP
jgi:basic membrane protein A